MADINEQSIDNIMEVEKVGTEPTAIQKKGMNNIIVTQIFGNIGWSIYGFGLMLLYLKKLHFSQAEILFYLTIPNLLNSVLSMPCAYFSDKYGKKILGNIGMIVTVFAFLAVAIPGFYGPGEMSRWIVVTGILVASACSIMFSCSFFALVDPIVPKDIRGRFFGKLTFASQVIVLAIFMNVCQFVLKEDTELKYFSIIFVLIAISQIPRIFSYMGIPELEKTKRMEEGFRESLIEIMSNMPFMAFSCYVFFLMLTTGGCLSVFGLLEKDVLGFNDQTVVWMGLLTMIGTLIGFIVAGKPIDKIGTKPLFFACHIGYSMILFAFVGRELFNMPLQLVLGGLHFIFGFIAAACYVALMTEMMALIPEKNKSMATSFNTTLLCTGHALSGVICSFIVDLGILRKNWNYHGLELSHFDSILIIFGFAILLLVLTLGLIPSVTRKPVRMRLPVK